MGWRTTTRAPPAPAAAACGRGGRTRARVCGGGAWVCGRKVWERREEASPPPPPPPPPPLRAKSL